MIKKYLLLILIVFATTVYSKQDNTEKTTGDIQMVHIPSGTYVMGKDCEGRDYSPQHSVIISKGFWMGKYEITQKQYLELTGANPCEKSKYGEGDSLPVYNISWYDAVQFCNKLSEAAGLKPYYKINTGSKDDDNVSPNDNIKWEVNVDEKADGFRLPTEAQWEYCCRAGTKTDFYWGKDSSWDFSGKYSWHMFNAGMRRYNNGTFWWVKYHKVKKVGTRIPNKFGLYDMNGNVAEWCYDRYSRSYYSGEDKTDPSGFDGEYVYRVVRGGTMLDSPKDFTSYSRWPVEPFERIGMNGLRVVLPE